MYIIIHIRNNNYFIFINKVFEINDSVDLNSMKFEETKNFNFETNDLLFSLENQLFKEGTLAPKSNENDILSLLLDDLIDETIR